MDLNAEVVIFVGAGASLPKPSGGPLFAVIRDACVKRAGSDTRRLYEAVRQNCGKARPPGLLLLDHVIPEVFLKEFADAGYELHEPLARAVRGSPGTGPNAVHRLLVELLVVGGEVWTTNWDTWIEQAWLEETGSELKVAVAPEDDPTVPGIQLFKVHGSTSRPQSLRFATPDIMRPFSPAWHDRLVRAAAGRVLVVLGYGGADVDLFPTLDAAIRESRAAYWFEGSGQDPFEKSVSANYELWRFQLEGVVDPNDLPASGTHLVWCGGGSTVSSPSEGVLAAFGCDGDVTEVPSWQEQFDAVDAVISQVGQEVEQRGKRLRLSALVSERMGNRWTAALRHAGVVIVGPTEQRSKSIRSIGNLVLLRTQPLRRQATRLATLLIRNRAQVEFLRSQAGVIDHDPELARRVADGRQNVDIDDALTIALATRWKGDLGVAERIARMQLSRALAEDLSSSVRDWPERVSRACFELAQALVWQGRVYEAEDQARIAYMRISGAKWTAWEYTFRAIASFSNRNFEEASDHLDVALRLLRAEGFHDFTPQVWCQRAACARAMGDLSGARKLLANAKRIPRKGPGTRAALLAERAEIALAAGRDADAAEAWTALAGSGLPLWSALGFLRLAERGHRPHVNARRALGRFEAISCQWGILRTSALLGLMSDEDLNAKVSTLGPTGIYQPDGPWLL